MIGPDDFGDRRSANHTPTIALSIAAVLLLVVGAMSYRESVRSTLEKEYAEKEARLMQRQGLAPLPAAPAAPAPVAGAAPAATGTVLYDAQGNPVYLTGLPPAAAAAPVAPAPAPVASAAQVEAETTLPAPEDPDIARFQQSLEQARQQGQATDQRFNQLAGNAATAPDAAPAAPAGTTGSAEITSELPDFLRDAVNNPPGGSPEMDARLDRMRSQILAAASLGKVTSYDKDWGIVTFNAGAAQGVKKDQRFAVRRGSEVLGWVKVDQVDEDQAIAVLVTKNRDSDTAVKPDVGDDLIDFELF
ncbi:MAG: hypothetical protein JNJ70_23575 [Verrucomicrobiales bacterium]|nr:hypothetical protein [Verrucomicrobiales bacterium]